MLYDKRKKVKEYSHVLHETKMNKICKKHHSLNMMLATKLSIHHDNSIFFLQKILENKMIPTRNTQKSFNKVHFFQKKFPRGLAK